MSWPKLCRHTRRWSVRGEAMKADMRKIWQPDQVFFDLLHDKEAITGIVREIAGDAAANAHLASHAKVQKKIVGDCLSGDLRKKAEIGFPATWSFQRGTTDKRLHAKRPPFPCHSQTQLERNILGLQYNSRKWRLTVNLGKYGALRMPFIRSQYIDRIRGLVISAGTS